MRAGRTEFLQEPITAAALRQAISRLVAHRASPAGSGEVFAFVGAKGGVGTTTVAVNVATALAKVAPSQTLLVDLHLAHGDAALLFGAEPRFSIVDALENIAPLRRGVLPRPGDVRRRPDRRCWRRPTARSRRRASTPQLQAVIEFAARLYRYVVLDVPRSDAAALDALDAASRIVVVANQELATVRSASRLAAALRQRYGHDRVLVIVSRFDKQADIGQADIEKVVGVEGHARAAERLPAGAAGAQQGPAAGARQPQQAGGRVQQPGQGPGTSRFRAEAERAGRRRLLRPADADAADQERDTQMISNSLVAGDADRPHAVRGRPPAELPGDQGARSTRTCSTG